MSLGRILIKKEEENMKWPIAVATIFAGLLLISSRSEGKQSNATQTERDLTNLAAEWAKTTLTRDRAVLERIWAADFVYTTDDPDHVNDGRMLTKQDLLAAFGSDRNKYSTAENRNVKVRLYGTEFAVSTGDYHVTGSDQNGKQFDRISRWTNVWVRRGGSWHAVAAHNTWLPIKK